MRHVNKRPENDTRFPAHSHLRRKTVTRSNVERDKFLKPGAAERFAPVLSGLDPVRFANTGQEVDGHREHGALFGGKMYLFADEESLLRFEKQPQRYAAVARQAMAKSAPKDH